MVLANNDNHHIGRHKKGSGLLKGMHLAAFLEGISMRSSMNKYSTANFWSRLVLGAHGLQLCERAEESFL